MAVYGTVRFAELAGGLRAIASRFLRPYLGIAQAIALLCFSFSSAADTLSLASVDDLKIDTGSISLSGVSSGAFMAHQVHVIHSRHISGVGILAGGPYRCANERRFLSWFDLTGLYAATSVCSDTNPFWFFQGPPSAEFSIDETSRQAAIKVIDDPSHMRTDKVWLFSGGMDRAVPTAVVDTLNAYYQTFVSEQNIQYEKHAEANHAMITTEFGNRCDAFEPPYINDCDFDAAERLFRHIYGDLQPKAANADLQPVIAFDQREFFDVADKSVSMNDVGHVYIPKECADGKTCRVHVALHGCGQHQEIIGDAFFAKAAYNNWAETNQIVVLYPQATAWSERLLFRYRENPHGCWDWWGYSGENFANRSGKQVMAVGAMLNTLIGEALFEPARPSDE
jgi:poly(3-hydroxybutyrate) depolymerase